MNEDLGDVDDTVSIGPGDGSHGAGTTGVNTPQPHEHRVESTVVPGGDGSHRRRTAMLVVAAAVIAGLVGGLIGHRIQSPADRAAARSAPTPSLITVPVERRALTSELVLAGQVSYNEPTLVQLAGSVGITPGEAAVVTDLRPTGDVIQEGDILLEVTGRPVLALQGPLPMYRRLVIGSEGPDVVQLEEALVRLGYPVEPVDSVFDDSTAAAVEQMYVDAGYTAEGPSVDERDALTGAQEAVRQAEENLSSARDAVADASRPMLESERLQLERTLVSARAAVPAALAAADATQTEADQVVAAARASRSSAQVTLDAAVSLRDAALQGAIDPDTGTPYSAERIGSLQVEAAQANEALVGADAALVSAETQRSQAVAGAEQSIADAEFQLQLTEAQYAEATAPGDTSALDTAVVAAQEGLDASTTNLVALQAATGLRISPGEIVFVPVLPSTVTESYVALGSTVQGPVGTLATSSTLVSGRVSRVDSGLVAVGAPVAIDIRGSGVTTTGTVLSVGAPAANNQDGQQPGGGESSGRLEVTIAPDDPATVANYVFWDARIVVTVASTEGAVLVVPVAALTVGPDEVSQVEVERTPATDDVAAVTEVVEVEVGLTSNGLAEVRPIEEASLAEGDRVVIGFETNERLNEDDTEGPTVVDSSDSSGDGSSDSSGDVSDDDSVTSPLAALMGWESNPIEDRRKQLEVEELTSDCMRDLGFEYEPVDYSSQFNPEDDLQFSDPQGFGEKYGYGIMRNYELYETGEPIIDNGFEDPNQDYVNGLSPAEQTAYYEALYGSGIDEAAAFEEPAVEGIAIGSVPTEGTIVIEPTPQQQGCNGIAAEQVYGDSFDLDPEVQSVIDDYYQNIQNDPRLDEAYDLWATCMADIAESKGISKDLNRPEDMYSVVDRFKTEALGLEAIEVSSEAEMNEYFESGEPVYSAQFDEDGTGVVFLGEPEPLSGDEIDRLTGLEVELWKQDQQCQGDANITGIQRELEQGIVDQLTSQFPDLGK